MLLIAVMAAGVCGQLVNAGPLPYLVAFGAVAASFDATARRLARCEWFDVSRGSQFVHIPVWVLGAMVAFGSGVILLALWLR
jgi:hypothetical protein